MEYVEEKGDKNMFNDRHLNAYVGGKEWYKDIYNFLKGQKSGKIPNNYYYSNGSKYNKYV
jgi:hypothetical protein